MDLRRVLFRSHADRQRPVDDAEGEDGRPRPRARRRRRRVLQGRPERAGGRGPAVAADLWAYGWRHAGVSAGIGNWGLGIGTSGFAPALRFHESLIPTSQSRLLAAPLAQAPEHPAARMRRLVALAPVERGRKSVV